LILPEPATTDVRYQAQLIDGNGRIGELKLIEQDARSVTFEIPASELARGQYAVNLSTINADDTPQRIPGSYQFIIE
jgi:hypothetical protein